MLIDYAYFFIIFHKKVKKFHFIYENCGIIVNNIPHFQEQKIKLTPLLYYYYLVYHIILHIIYVYIIYIDMA